MPETEEKKPGVVQKFILNPIRGLRGRRARLAMEKENRLRRRDESMKQYVECFLMQCEERLTWCAYELNNRNFQRLLRKEELAKIERSLIAKQHLKDETEAQENGLLYHRGQIVSYRCWQNSPAKHLDLTGHTAPVLSCKLSKCLGYVVSCSMDMTCRIWSMKNGKCIMKLSGHTKKVNGCDIHDSFAMGVKSACIVTASGDKTLRLWNTTSEIAVKTLFGHSETVYRCCFSPDGRRIVSCSEDLTVKTWCFPEGFALFTYRAHTSPVTSVCFSPTGRYSVLYG